MMYSTRVPILGIATIKNNASHLVPIGTVKHSVEKFKNMPTNPLVGNMRRLQVTQFQIKEMIISGFGQQEIHSSLLHVNPLIFIELIVSATAVANNQHQEFYSRGYCVPAKSSAEH